MNLQDQIDQLTNPNGRQNGNGSAEIPEIPTEKLVAIYQEQQRISFIVGFGTAVAGIFLLRVLTR